MSQRDPALGPALRRAWIGYQRRLDEAMAAAGFAGRRFPDGRVLRLARDTPDLTISGIGRELGISRQGAAKVVADLQQRGYLAVGPSPTSGRERRVTTTPLGLEYLAARRRAALAIERRVRAQVGADAVAALHEVLAELAPGDDARLRSYLRTPGQRGV